MFLAYLEVETQNFVVSLLKIELELAGGKEIFSGKGYQFTALKLGSVQALALK